jgi:gliding motility-associated-like protein
MLPVPHISISDVSCFGKKDGFIVMDSITNGQPPYLCSFDDGPFTAQKQFTNLSAGEHTIVVSDANGCERTLVFSVKQPEEVTVSIEGSFEGDENTIDLGGSVVLQVITTPPFGELDTIIWTPDSLIACPTCPSNEVSPTEQTTFSVMIEKSGCSDEDRLTVFVKKDHPVFVPNAFSPNEDGKNDIFGIHNNPKIANVKSFLIFNRWGETMYEHYNFVPEPTPDNIGWDGTHRGEKMNPAVFTWFAEIEFIDGVVEIFEGDLVLLR